MDFKKMQGLGNDFVVLDARTKQIDLNSAKIQKICDRKFGIGCDQLIVMEPSNHGDLFMRIYNPDESQAEACGNATRCIAYLSMEETRKDTCLIDSLGGILKCKKRGQKLIEVNMGKPKDIQDLSLEGKPVYVDMGNPHCVFFPESESTYDIRVHGPATEHHKHFPNRTNVEHAFIQDDASIRLHVWERGAGITLACGSGACATYAAAVHRGLIERIETPIIMDGGQLSISYNQDDEILMTGPVDIVFDGTLVKS